MEYTRISTFIEDRVGIISMDSPGNLNAIDEVMADELIDALDSFGQDPEVKVILLKSAAKAFSAGGDIKFFYEQIQSGEGVDLEPLIKRVGQVSFKIKTSSKMVVCAVDGAAAGAGVSLALSGDFILCTESAKLIMAFTKIGLVPDTGGTYLLAKALGPQYAMELCATGRPLEAREALDAHLVTRVFAKEEFDEGVKAFIAKLLEGPAVAYCNLKKQMFAASFSDYERFLERSEIPTQRECSHTADFEEGVKAFIEKRPPKFSDII